MTGNEKGKLSYALMDFSFWEEAWQRSADTVLRSRRPEGLKGQVEFWNRRAEEFAGKVMPDSTRVEEIISWLAAQGVRFPGSKVLDVGSGPGAFALPLAARGAEVVAVEPAGAMISALKENLSREKISDKVHVVKELWEKVDVEGLGWAGEFDLVFASMSPGINSWETIAKALKCSRKHCYFSSFAGERFSPHYGRLWEILYGQKMPPWPADIFYINQLLLLQGYEVTFHVWNRRRTETLKAPEMVETFLKFFRQYGEEVPHMAETIRTYVEGRLQKDAFSHEINTRLGKVLVKLNGAGP